MFRHIQRAALILMAGTFLDNLLGFTKSLFIASYYGTSVELDAYFLSLAPLRMVLGVLIGALQVTLIPRYIELKEQEGPEFAFAFFATWVLWVLLLCAGMSGVLFLGASKIAAHLGKGLVSTQIGFITSLLKLSTVFLLFSVVNALGKVFLQAYRRFFLLGFLPALSGVFSLSYIVCFRAQGVSSLMYGLILGIVVQAGITLRGVSRFFPQQKFLLPLTHLEIKKTGKLLWPLLIGSALVHVNVVVDQVMASTLPAGSIAALQYAIKLHSVLTQMFVMVVSQALFPYLSQQAAEKNFTMLQQTFLLTIKRTLYVLLPLSLCIIFWGNSIVELLFQRGAFTSHSTAATAGAWIAYTLGLPVQAVGVLAARVYNALQDNLTLMYVSGIGIVLNVFFNVIFMRYWGHVGIALSTSGVYLMATSVLLYLLHRKIKKKVS